VAVDRVIGDFMAGAVETLVVGACKEADWVFVEGQGSLLHPDIPESPWRCCTALCPTL
jgi:uncharacterized NAD-dependent epimerase/dehydratase family protein